MNEIRKNTEEEVTYLEGKFKISLGAILGYLLGLLAIGAVFSPVIVIFVISFTGMSTAGETADWRIMLPFLIIMGAIFVGYNVYKIFRLAGIKKNKLYVTNKRIYGLQHVIFSKTSYSYRLDEIDNVEMNSTFGQHILKLIFTNGASAPTTVVRYSRGGTVSSSSFFSIPYLENYQEIYDKMVELLASKKNLVDLDTDIRMSAINTESRKAEALEKMATNINGGGNNTAPRKKGEVSYIEEIKQLKELLDSGAISKEEYEQEKKEILNNNHK